MAEASSGPELTPKSERRSKTGVSSMARGYFAGAFLAAVFPVFFAVVFFVTAVSPAGRLVWASAAS